MVGEGRNNALGSKVDALREQLRYAELEEALAGAVAK